MKKNVFKILAFCGLLCLTSCDYGTTMYVDLNDTIHTTFVVSSVKKIYGETNEQIIECMALNKYEYKFVIKANPNNLSYGDTLIITKKVKYE